MEWRFFSELEYRNFIRKIPEGIKFETRSEPFKIPIILFVDTDINPYL